MLDLTDRLGRLYDDADGPASEATVAADVQRGRHALRLRRARVTGVAGGALVLVTATALVIGGAGGGSSGPVTAQRTGPGTHAPTSSDTVPAPALRLVAYTGAQRPGFVVDRVPEGYVLQGVSGAVLDVSRAGDTSPLDSFVDKLVVSVDNDVTPDGTPVSVGGKAGFYSRADDGTQQLYFHSGANLVNVQSWSTIALTRDQLVSFAEGITVTKDVQVSHG